MNVNDTQWNRRKFLGKSLSAITSAYSVCTLSSCAAQRHREAAHFGILRRQLGTTGLQVSILGFGGGSQFLKNKDGAWEPLLQRAVDAGINFFDTSAGYQWGASMTSEERFGKVLSPYRKRIILSTKCDSREPDGAMKEFERSLKRMRTDYVDILMIHSIEASEDLEALEKGLYPALVKLKEQKAARFIGFSCMNSAAKSKVLLDRLHFDVALLAMNPTGYGDFAKVTLPSAVEKHTGVAAMKVLRGLVGKKATAQELLTYAWDLPGVSTALVGHYGSSVLEENIRLAEQFSSKGTKALNHKALEARLAKDGNPHTLCWARPGYFDGMMT
jgi:aryl-alcohol dehydrogenase-like predicted oxidoreductase